MTATGTPDDLFDAAMAALKVIVEDQPGGGNGTVGPKPLLDEQPHGLTLYISTLNDIALALVSPSNTHTWTDAQRAYGMNTLGRFLTTLTASVDKSGYLSYERSELLHFYNVLSRL